MSARALEVVRCLLWQAGRSPAEADLEAAWRDAAAAGAEPTAVELLARLRARGALAGSLLACEGPPAVLASTSGADGESGEGEGSAPAAPELAVGSAPTLAVPGPAPAPEPAAPAPEADGAASGWSYELLETIGEGGMGTVHLAWDRHLLRQAAVKRLRDDPPRPGARARFLYEAQVLSQLDHPNVLPVYALAVEPGGPAACAMKLVRGRTLEALVEAHRAWGPTRAAAALPDRLEVFLKVCEGVAYAHARGVVHRDLKPANIMVGDHGEVWVLDWGLCKLVRHAAAPPPVEGAPDPAPAAGPPPRAGVELARTQVGALKGTPLYFSPEQAEGDPARVGPASDQYALGLLLHELLALRPAYEASGLQAVLAQAVEARRGPYPEGVRVAPDLRAIVDRATARRPEDRYASVQDLADDVRRHLRREETRALPDDLLRAARRRLDRHAGAVVAALAAALALALGVGAWRALERRAAAAEARAAAEGRAREEQAARRLLDARAARVVRHFLWYAGELEGVASAAEQALRAGAPSAEPAYDRARFRDPAAAPPDLAPSDHYRAAISPTWPLAEAPASADPARARADLARLLAVRPRLVDALRGAPPEAAPEAAGARRLPPRPGEAVEWAYVILEATGAVVLLPGTAAAGWAEGADLRDVPTYRAARAEALAGHTRGWSAPYEDLLGQGRLVTRNRALLDPDGALLGVASLDLSLDRVARVDLAPGDGVRWAGLLDAEGRVVVASEGAPAPAGAPGPGGLLALAPYRRAEVVARLVAEPDGLLRPPPDGATIVAWERLDPLPWTLVVEVGR